jgi:glycosyltransferase involved in cell wall biosynthesis
VKVLLCIHHRLDPDQGAPGVTLALGAALQERGCVVDYLGFDHVFGDVEREHVSHQIRFPWSLAWELTRRSGAFDVIDASTGDAWVWATLGRPRVLRRRAGRADLVDASTGDAWFWATLGRVGGRSTALVTRAHGLEHIAAREARRAARENLDPLSWKFPVYHGGTRLWEVRRSLRKSDQCVFLNSKDRDFACGKLGVAPERATVVANGVADHFHDLPRPDAVEGPLRLAFVGRWSPAKGAAALVDTVAALEVRGIDFRLSLLGTMTPPPEVLADFPERLRARISVTPQFENVHLPKLLVGGELFVFPSLSEGSSGALLEAMACGLAPVATPVGSARTVIPDGGGVVAEPGEVADAVARLGADRGSLLDMRRRAQEHMARYNWDSVAEQTVGVYERAVAARSTASRKRPPADVQL